MSMIFSLDWAHRPPLTDGYEANSALMVARDRERADAPAVAPRQWKLTLKILRRRSVQTACKRGSKPRVS